MWISAEDLRTFSGIGKVLWLDKEVSRKSTLETLSVVGLLQKTPESGLERATQALLDLSKRDSKSAHTGENLRTLNQPFYRLTQEERLILVALHIGRWSYERLARITKQNVDQVQEMAWSARLKIAPQGFYPHGPHPIGEECPKYDPKKPWAQQFLDGEITQNRDRVFLEKHLISCTACSSFLTKSRELYFHVEKEVAALACEPEWIETIQALVKNNPRPGMFRQKSFPETLAIFFVKNRDIQWIIYIFLGSVIYGLLKHFRH